VQDSRIDLGFLPQGSLNFSELFLPWGNKNLGETDMNNHESSYKNKFPEFKFTYRKRNILFDYHLLNSQAYAELRPTARKLLEGFHRRIKKEKKYIETKPGKRSKKPMWVSVNLDSIIFTYKEMMEYTNKTSGTINYSLDQLIGLGFIDITHQGQAYKRDDCSIYAISERWKNYGTPKFKEVTREKDYRRGHRLKKWQKKERKKLKPDLMKIVNREVATAKSEIEEIVIKTGKKMKRINRTDRKTRYIWRRLKSN
jgi:hypothetical protein